MSLHVRQPAVAGLFYPADAQALRAAAQDHLSHAPLRQVGEAPKALVVPHAGYVYSGPVAASAYALLAPLRDRLRRVVLLGPSHRIGFDGLAASNAEIFETPLGQVEVDQEAVERALTLPQVQRLDAAHAQEHSLEVQLPFLQLMLSDFRLVLGDATPTEVAEVIDVLWGGAETLVVVSSDLSHYLSYEEARSVDRATTRAIESLEPEAIGPDQACGRLPVQGLLLAAKRHGLHARTLDLRNSGDTAGSRDSVVGYGAYAFA